MTKELVNINQEESVVQQHFTTAQNAPLYADVRKSLRANARMCRSMAKSVLLIGAITCFTAMSMSGIILEHYGFIAGVLIVALAVVCGFTGIVSSVLFWTVNSVLTSQSKQIKPNSDMSSWQEVPYTSLN